MKIKAEIKLKLLIVLWKLGIVGVTELAKTFNRYYRAGDIKPHEYARLLSNIGKHTRRGGDEL